MRRNVSYENPIGSTDFGPPPRAGDPLPYPSAPSETDGLPYGSDTGGCVTYGDISFTGNAWLQPPMSADIELANVEYALLTGGKLVPYSAEGFFSVCPYERRRGQLPDEPHLLRQHGLPGRALAPWADPAIRRRNSGRSARVLRALADSATPDRLSELMGSLVARARICGCWIAGAAVVMLSAAEHAGAQTIGANFNRPTNVQYGCELVPSVTFDGFRQFFPSGVTTCTYLPSIAFGNFSESTAAPFGLSVVTRIQVKTDPSARRLVRSP